MAKLILSMDGLVLKEYTVTKERTTIGRKPHNDIQIDNLAVSGEHAVIVTILNDSFLEDLGSTNGTLVNGQPIKKHFLQNNDVVELGKYKLKYVSDGTAAVAKTEDFERTMVLRPKPAVAPAAQQNRTPSELAVSGVSAPANVGASTTFQKVGASAQPAMPQGGFNPGLSPPAPVREAPAVRQPTPAAAVAAPTRQPTAPIAPPPATARSGIATIQILSGSNAGRELDLTKALTTLGKPGVQVAVITKRPQGYYITHVEGAIFPIVNGKTLDPQAHLLVDHDVIELAGVKMEFYLK
jgi:predicted component of type VI protein secretion system